mmetsp:Transcript_27554/g.52439  ORF Transcript_27554/g.52439 Transcript_27554/m.52439 type:complete len:282 (+) Transcript_27554:508-1353(+)
MAMPGAARLPEMPNTTAPPTAASPTLATRAGVRRACHVALRGGQPEATDAWSEVLAPGACGLWGADDWFAGEGLVSSHVMCFEQEATGDCQSSCVPTRYTVAGSDENTSLARSASSATSLCQGRWSQRAQRRIAERERASYQRQDLRTSPAAPPTLAESSSNSTGTAWRMGRGASCVRSGGGGGMRCASAVGHASGLASGQATASRSGALMLRERSGFVRASTPAASSVMLGKLISASGVSPMSDSTGPSPTPPPSSNTFTIAFARAVCEPVSTAFSSSST